MFRLSFKNLSPFFYISVGLFFYLISAANTSAATRQTVHGHIPVAATNLTPVGSVPSNQRLHLAIGLPLRNQSELADFLQQISDPLSPNYRHFLTPAQFAERFGPSEQDYQAIVDFAQRNGLTVTGRHPNRVIVDVEGAVSDIEKALHVKMQSYRHPSEARDFFAPNVEPSVDLGLSILQISGLENYSLPKPNLKMKSSDLTPQADPNSGSGSGGAYAGSDFRAAYVPGVSLTGLGQSVGLLQFDGYYPADITAYRQQFGLPNIRLINVPIDGGVSVPGSENSEVCLDIEMVMSMAPGLSAIYVYEAPNSSPWVDILSRMANDNTCKQLSCSWGGGGPNPTAEAIFQQMAAQGQSFFNASGDSEAFTSSIPFPSDSPNITEVGATTLTTSTSGGGYVSEKVWNWNNGTGSSGGISTYYSIPTWQQGLSMGANQGSSTKRNVPDVAMVGDNVFVRYNNGNTGSFGGTSCAAPLWAAFVALVNQRSVANGRSTVGFINPAIYRIGKGASYSSSLHDITTGNNYNCTSLSKFTAVSGYDLCTGWGSPIGASLITALAGPADTLQVSNSSPSTVVGVTGGPFFPTANSYWLVNNGNASLTWRVSSNQSWITLSSTSGTILAGGTFSLTASINAAANSLASGTYGAVITFTDLATGVSQTQQISLFITSPNPVLSVTPASGFQTTCPSGGSWAPSSATYTILNSGNAQMSWSVSHSSTWIGVSPADGTLAAGGTSSITVNITSSANTLSAGNYTDTLAFTNLSNGAGNTTIPVTLTQLPPPPVITSGSTTTGSQGNPFSYQVNASNHPTGFTANGLPAGLVIDSASGMISGTPINAGTSTVTVSASNAGGTGNSTLMILVWPSPPVITCASSAVGYKNISFSFSITATNGPTDFTAPGLPDGLSLNAATGVISGTPTATGTANVVIGASNATGSGTAALQLVILATPPPVTAFYYVGVGWVSGGGSQFFTTANSTITASNNYDNGVSMSIITPGYADWWYLDFAAQGNDPLTTGTYLGATRFPFQTGTPGLSFDGDGRGDNTLTGYFNVLDIVYLSGSVFSFAADFVQFDEGNTSQWTMGSIRYNSIVPIRMNLMPDIGGVSAIGFTANSELINATINPNGFSTNWSIRYGPDAAYGYNTPTQSISRGVGGISVGGILTGLLANTTYHYQVVAASSSGTSTSQDLTFTTLATTPSAPIITSAAAATANQSQEFSYQITATNNPIAYSASGLPAGLSLDPSTGLISGSPVGSGVYQVTLAAMNGGGSGNMVLTLTSLPPPPVIIGSLSQTGGVGVAFNYQIQALNNPSSYVASGLPAGLSINGATGLISGTPTQTVTSNATISASNAGGTGSANLAITVITIPSITSSTSTSIAQGHSFSYQIKANNNPSAYNAVGLPPGLSCNASTGLISGTPSANGLTCVTISATNAGGTGNAPLLINVIPAVPVITSGTSAAGGINVRFLYTIAANNNASSFNASGLPAGLSINTATGLISGTPTSTGTSNVIISADNFVGTGTANLTIIISLTPPPVTAFYYYGNGYVAQGQSTYYSTDTGSSITASINYDKGVSLSVNGPYGTDWWYLDFAAPGNVPLTTGTFPGAARFPFQAGSAGLSWYGDGRGDNTLSGYFNVLDVVYSNGLLVSFAADFVQYDECNVSRWNVGSIRYNSTIPVTYPAPPTLVGPFASGVTTSGALLSGAVNPNGPKTSIFFQYGLDTTYGNTTPSQTLSSATTSYAISSSLTGLFQNTTYHYRLLAISTAGVSISPDSMFTTVEIPLAPVINSSLSTTGTQGGVVSYQIAATNFPSGYGGNALPAGLFVNPATGLISGTLSQSGVFRVDITALNSRGTGHAILNIQAITPYQAWQHQIFGPKLLGDPGLSADLAAPSSDGIPNLMKYALNLTPMAVATSGLPTQGLMQDEYNNTFQTLSYTRVIAATDIAYIVEVSDDLLTWFSDDSYTTIVGATNHPDGLTQTVVVRDLRPVNDFTRHFIRLNISKP